MPTAVFCARLSGNDKSARSENLKNDRFVPVNGRWSEGQPWPRSRAAVDPNLSVLRHFDTDSGTFVKDAVRPDGWLDGGLTDDDRAAAPIAWQFWRESEDDFVVRARQHCSARNALVNKYPAKVHAPAEHREVLRHCEWLVRARLLNKSPGEIAENEGPMITLKAVSVALRRLERVLELEPLRRPGRPRQEIGT